MRGPVAKEVDRLAGATVEAAATLVCGDDDQRVAAGAGGLNFCQQVCDEALMAPRHGLAWVALSRFLSTTKKTAGSGFDEAYELIRSCHQAKHPGQ